MLSDISAFAHDCALEAGSILLKGFRSPDTKISHKGRSDLVTSVDRSSEDFLYNAISSRFSNHSIIAEEGSRKDTDGSYIWYVDPLDGTNNFASGLPFFCVSLGIYSRETGNMAAGVVYNPFIGELFSAVRGRGAFLNGSPVTVSRSAALQESILATGFPYDKHINDNNNLSEFGRFLPKIRGIRRMGSAAIDLCYVAAGWLDGYWERSLHPWDIAAGSLIVEEAGGMVTSWSGEIFDPEMSGILASNGKIHSQMVEVLSGK